MTDKSENDVRVRIDGVFNEMDRRSWERHFQDDCTLLDDRCCVRGWQRLRVSNPMLAQDVELLYGKDFWKRLPTALRSLLVLGLLETEHTDEQLQQAAARGLRAARQGIEDEKVRAIRRGRSARADA